VDEKHKRRICDFEEACAAVEIIKAWQIDHEKHHDEIRTESRSDRFSAQQGIREVQLNLSVTHMAMTEKLVKVEERLGTVVAIGASVASTLKALMLICASALVTGIAAIFFKRFAQ
jgi:hypothetical protein